MKKMEADTFKLTVHPNGYTELLIKHNAIFDVNDIQESKKLIIQELKEKKAYILVEAEGTFYTSKEARELGASDTHATHHGAIAFCSDKLAYKLLGKLYIRINRPKVPTKYFTARKEAISWLLSIMEKNSKKNEKN